MRLEGQNTRVTSRSLARQPRRRRFHGDDGSIIAESALLVPFFVLLLFGMLEFGGAFRDYLTLSNGVTTGARQAAIQGNNSSADWNIILSVKDAMNAMPMSQIRRIVIFKAATATSTLDPTKCKVASSATDKCNVYTTTSSPTPLSAITRSATMPTSWSDCSGPTVGYCPTGRSVAATSPEYVGVFVEVVHPWITGLFGQTITLTQVSVTRIEPTSY